ncbi:jg12277 [Pararge aegeria aegeria]|uniref:Jg12277 protein n=1 Tax=Pararge aegeria aegeria TaxID=348720 RepID=A0A8S4QT32_9NEOP|nr:jg12277 [Pararge aegeria aegeria]
MNAEAKKKVDVLSEELLPYIIAEQERRTTLYKRIMTAIQNGEKGVTVAEIRGKPPVIIRKGLFYRCPANRAPKEPDGSGTLMCEEEVEPSQVMYDSCLSAEDKELYVAENRYFFCNQAKKKVDVLSEELLPYIIAEQERRTTLYKRIMTAIQNGEKGVTVAEIRGKPPVIIRKGLFYRCPANRAPKEPDGSGTLMCEEEVEPSQVMYDSCLSAEDKELYVAENRYFFCNRHKVEGPDLPRNGTTVIGCAPIERTSLNYTANKCALEDTDDVVVHYRYYPDRTYKFVTELDPDREVCDHWNPCQIGYIFSLPSPDQAVTANELWRE